MNRKSILIALAIAATVGTASAESYVEYNTPFASSGSRAAVNAELAQARQAGVNPWSTSYNPQAQFRSTKTRAQVVGEYLAARGVVDAFTGEDSGSAYLTGSPAAAGETCLAGQSPVVR